MDVIGFIYCAYFRFVIKVYIHKRSKNVSEPVSIVYYVQKISLFKPAYKPQIYLQQGSSVIQLF